MDIEKARYVLRYYERLMKPQEQRAYRHLMGTAKATHGRTDTASQREAESSSHPARGMLSNDPEALQLASDGIDAFMVRTAQRILDERSSEIAFNYCPRCGALAKTPRARQCVVVLVITMISKRTAPLEDPPLLLSQWLGHPLNTPR